MVKKGQVGVSFPSSLKGSVGRDLAWMRGFFQRFPSTLFGKTHRTGGGGMTLLLRHSSEARVPGAEFPVLGPASSVICSVVPRGVCATQWRWAQRALELIPGGLCGSAVQWGTVRRHELLPKKIQLC